MKKRKLIIVVFGLILLFAVSCGAKDDPVLAVSGTVEVSYSQRELEALSMIDSEYTNKDGETIVFTGIAISDILSSAKVSDYSKITIIASDGYSAEITFEELSACEDCILTYSDSDGWSSVMPGFSGKMQVKDIEELNIQ